ncbi:MAG: DUF6580 family putative transport protein [Sphingomicrobium sp.]
MNSRILAIASAILIAATLRLVPHPPNFTPIGAIALFSGAMFGRRLLAFAAPLAAMLLSDAIIGFHSAMPVVYAAIALITLIGWALEGRRSIVGVGLASLSASMLFFLVTNLGVWATSGMYPISASGLAACFAAAMPFFQNSVAGDLFYSALLFGGFALIEQAVPALRVTGEPKAA